MSEQTSAFLTDPEIARRIRRTADDLAVERARAAAAAEGLEAELRELAADLHEDVPAEASAPAFPVRRGPSQQARLPI